MQDQHHNDDQHAQPIDKPPSVPSNPLLGPKHTGMRVSASGILTRIARGDRPDAGVRYMVGEMLKHLEQLGRDYYDGKPLIVDEFLQCYCLDDNRPNPSRQGTGHLVHGTLDGVVRPSGVSE